MKTIPSSRRHHYVAIVSIFLTMLIALALIAGMVGCGASAVTFADPNLEAVIRATIAIPEEPIYPSDLEALTSINATEKSIADLTGLEHCASLTDLNLSWNDTSDISPLATFTSLTYLDLCSSRISDISPLVDNGGLSEGDKVILSGNPLSSDSIRTYIPQLEARGVIVEY